MSNNPEQAPADKSVHEDKEKHGSEDSEQMQQTHSFPAPTFSTFILSLASSTLVHLGEVPEPTTGQLEKNLPVAKHTIDILTMLQDKITNGINDEEKQLLEGILYELRMKFIVKKD